MRAMKLFLAVLFVVGLSTQALAVYMPPAGEPLFIKFNNVEQIFAEGLSQYGENNWGVFEVSSIQLGDITIDQYNYPAVGQNIWSNDGTQGEITGMFYGINPSPDVTGAFNSSDGSLILFWNATPIAELNQPFTDRTGMDSFTNFTDGVFLAKLDFYNGAILDGALNTSITGTTTPTSGGFTGIANSFAVVDAGYMYDGDLGLWAALLDGNYFPVENGLPNADIKFRNIYENTGTHAWDGTTGIFGADSTDPARVYTVVPEPSTMILLGAGLLGLAGLGYRRRNK